MKSNLTKLTAALLVLGHSVAFAGDDKINCRDEVVDNKTVYYGPFYCTDSFVNDFGETETIIFDHYIESFPAPSWYTTDLVTGLDGKKYNGESVNIF